MPNPNQYFCQLLHWRIIGSFNKIQLNMGKLRDLLSHLIRYTPKKDLTSPFCTHPNLPQKQQLTKLVVNAHDHCRSCEQRICLVCSEVHVQRHCTLDLRVNKHLGQGTLKDFNLGYLMEISLIGLKCICGKPLGFETGHAICAACGLASCSQKCHTEWEGMGNCTYSQNYFEKPKEITMRSIVFTNIRNIQSAKIREWNLANKSTLSYIACYARAGATHIYLQRGYRNYGIPQPELVQRMRKVPFGLDYTTHIQRVCDCKCEICVDRRHHSVGNCQLSCVETRFYNEMEFIGNHQLYMECDCDCPFCKTGVIVTRHTKMDCGMHCYKSDYNVSRIQ